MISEIKITTSGQALYEITDQVLGFVHSSDISEGLCTIYIQHTSASLTIQENADPSAKYDLERWLNRLVPENDPLYTHTYEGADDMPSHIKAILTNVSLSIPVINGSLVLGKWQGIYLWEHRKASHRRSVIVSLIGE